jgi:hypothetical protein
MVHTKIKVGGVTITAAIAGGKVPGITVSGLSEVRARDAEHGDYEDGFLCYRGHWYHLADFTRGGAPEGWHGC